MSIDCALPIDDVMLQFRVGTRPVYIAASCFDEAIDGFSEMPPDAKDDNADGANLMERVYVRSSLRSIS